MPDQDNTQPPEGDAGATAAPAPKGKGGKLRTEQKVTKTIPATGETVTNTDVVEEDVDQLPAQVKLAAPYAFYEDDGTLHSWAQGQIVVDAGEIALLVERGAIFEA